MVVFLRNRPFFFVCELALAMLENFASGAALATNKLYL